MKAKSLTDRLALLRELREVTDGRVPAELSSGARDVTDRAGKRLRFGEQTVVALAGATGSGKSSLFNAIAGRDLAAVGARRPTTSESFAVSFGPTNVALLDWLGVKRRNEMPPAHKGQENLVLLDLPDHDSTELSHHAEVDKMVRLVDQFVWVVDPQKYADAAIHQRYLRPLAGYRDVITVVLNQADKLSRDELAACLKDLRRLLHDDGLHDVPLLATSARTGQGVEELRDRLADMAARKTAAVARLNADVTTLTRRFDDATAGGEPGSPSPAVVATLNRSLEASAGVPLVTDAVRRSMVHRGQLATGWPLVKWLGRFRPDPLRRLRIGGRRAKGEIEPAVTERSSLPMRGSVADAQLRTGLRTLSSQLGEGMPAPWQQAVHDAVHTNTGTLPDTLDRAIVTADLGTERTPVWWQLLRVVQWLLIAAVAVGALWLTINVVLAYFGLPPLPGVPLVLPNGLEVPLPTVLVFGGLAVGLLLSVFSRVFVGLGARAAERRARGVLRRRVAHVGERDVLEPAKAELARYSRARELVSALR
ncbi:50S ribosome-binding GTPase [Tessaracoccus sp. OS52]|uniref:GTPase n=1 Tax=Tessaracoccus sp. OS52 TaxID=2886691 RepID=UPI001D117597|nr:GTPase [Tessaracoccus sp. OS52]MCC2592420.1 50S ribosome-binding GTPase [Tessaracoccus sp. OS52]